MFSKLRLATAGKPQAVAIALFNNTKSLPAAYKTLDRAVGGSLAAAIARPEFDASPGAARTVYPAKGDQRVYILGLGDRPAADSDEPVGLAIARALRKASAALLRTADSAQIKRLSLQLLPGIDGSLDAASVGRAVGEGLAAAQFTFDTYRKQPDPKPKAATLAIAAEPAVRKALDIALKVGISSNIARTLGATPPNIANPAYLVRYCRKLARDTGLSCTIIDAKKAAQLGMGGLTAVGQGGSTPPALICLEHKGTSRAKTKPAPIMLVGKAVTFDTGGYSLKPSAGMMDMKYDKCGGMAVIGAMHAAATLNVAPRVVGLIPTAENMVDTAAYRPNDIITFTNGVTCEITNTDAEGRLILADALAWGCKHYKPKAVIDLATLTGGVVVALGSFCAGCFCADGDLRSQLFDAADATGERLWHLPLWKEHLEMMKGTHSDIVNSGPREAHPIQGAAFLAHFVAKDGDFNNKPAVPWAHLDIAGVANTKADDGQFTKGPTGFGVRLLAQYLAGR